MSADTQGMETRETPGLEELMRLADQLGLLRHAYTMLHNAGTELARLKAENEGLREALEPFGNGAVATHVEGEDYSIMRERIVDWFGPSDFRRARRALTGPQGDDRCP